MAFMPHMRVLGPEYICCDAVHEEICSRANCITSVHDLDNISLLRAELRAHFYDIVMDTVGSAPLAKRQRRM